MTKTLCCINTQQTDANLISKNQQILTLIAFLILSSERTLLTVYLLTFLSYNGLSNPANTYAQLGALERMQQHWICAAKWFVKAAVTFNNNDDMQSVARIADIYMTLLQQSDMQTQDEIKQLWQQSGLEQTVDSAGGLIKLSNNIKKIKGTENKGR